MKLIAICNGLKRTISASGRLELVQMVSKLDIGQCASEDARWLERGTKHSL